MFICIAYMILKQTAHYCISENTCNYVLVLVPTYVLCYELSVVEELLNYNQSKLDCGTILKWSKI